MSKVLTIERSKGRRGGVDSAEQLERLGETYLLNDKGLMCCLGFDALACGFTTTQIMNQPNPASLCETYRESAPEGYEKMRLSDDVMRWHTEVVSEAIRANDAYGTPDSVREQEVRAALLKLGWNDVIFVD
jgi:hypothetical protein